MRVDCSVPCERDLDLVFMDLLVGWPAFGVWLAEQLHGLRPGGAWQRVAHSVMDPATGESDLELTWLHGDHGSNRILIENKIKACFQPRQAERYRERGQGYQSSGECDEYCTVLFAPESYLGPEPGSHGFDQVLSYEAVLAWLERQSLPELQFKRDLLRGAIDRHRRVYQPLGDDLVTAFWRDIASLVALLHPCLQFQYDGSERPARADALPFRPDGFSRGLVLWLRVPPRAMSYVQLLISGTADRLDQVVQLLGDLPADGYTIVPAGKSTAVRLEMAPIDAQKSVAEQADRVVNALAELDRLRSWTLERLESLAQVQQSE